jgi:hypothetical protein
LIPSIITHYFDPTCGPFRNICTLNIDDAELILENIRRLGHRKYKSNYLQRRIATEEWLYAERSRKLGKPRLINPIYFFLGECSWTDLARPLSIRLPLANFSIQMVTFTFPDSMTSLPLATFVDDQVNRKPYHGHVFTLDEIEKVIAEFGMPGTAVEESGSKYDTFIEVQVWDDTPLRKFMS